LSIASRGCARVMSQTEMAIFCPGLTMSLSGCRPIGWRSAATSAACGLSSADRNEGSMTVTRSSMSRQVDVEALAP
jgi:hypothetical protein